MEVLDNIPAKIELDTVLKKLRMRNTNADVLKTLEELIDMAQPVARPKAVFEMSTVENKNGDTVTVHGVQFTSHILRVNLDKAEEVFPYVVTCGREMDAIDIPTSEMMRFYFMDQIKEVVMRSALNYLHDYLREKLAC
jgi:hypothetical protein